MGRILLAITLSMWLIIASRFMMACAPLPGVPFRSVIPINRGAKVSHDDVIKWKHFPRNWPFVRGIHRSSVNSPHKGQWRGALMLSLTCVWINDWVNNREAGDLRCHRGHYDVNVMNQKSDRDRPPTSTANRTRELPNHPMAIVRIFNEM